MFTINSKIARKAIARDDETYDGQSFVSLSGQMTIATCSDKMGGKDEGDYNSLKLVTKVGEWRYDFGYVQDIKNVELAQLSFEIAKIGIYLHNFYVVKNDYSGSDFVKILRVIGKAFDCVGPYTEKVDFSKRLVSEAERLISSISNESLRKLGVSVLKNAKHRFDIALLTARNLSEENIADGMFLLLISLGIRSFDESMETKKMTALYHVSKAMKKDSPSDLESLESDNLEVLRKKLDSWSNTLLKANQHLDLVSKFRIPQFMHLVAEGCVKTKFNKRADWKVKQFVAKDCFSKFFAIDKYLSDSLNYSTEKFFKNFLPTKEVNYAQSLSDLSVVSHESRFGTTICTPMYGGANLSSSVSKSYRDVIQEPTFKVLAVFYRTNECGEVYEMILHTDAKCPN